MKNRKYDVTAHELRRQEKLKKATSRKDMIAVLNELQKYTDQLNGIMVMTEKLTAEGNSEALLKYLDQLEESNYLIGFIGTICDMTEIFERIAKGGYVKE